MANYEQQIEALNDSIIRLVDRLPTAAGFVFVNAKMHDENAEIMVNRINACTAELMKGLNALLVEAGTAAELVEEGRILISRQSIRDFDIGRFDELVTERGLYLGKDFYAAAKAAGMFGNIERKIFATDKAGLQPWDGFCLNIQHLVRILGHDSFAIMGGRAGEIFHLSPIDSSPVTLEIIKIVKEIMDKFGLVNAEIESPDWDIRATSKVETGDLAAIAEYIIENLPGYKSRICAAEIAIRLQNAVNVPDLLDDYKNRVRVVTGCDFESLEGLTYDLSKESIATALVITANAQGLSSGDLLKDVMGASGNGGNNVAKAVVKALGGVGFAEQVRVIADIAAGLNIPLTAITAASKTKREV